MVTKAVEQTGQLDVGGFPALLRGLVRELTVGRLEITCEAEVRNLWFDSGQVRSVVSEVEEEKLGRWLVARGVLDAQEMALALLRQPQGVRFGTYLVEAGLLAAERLIAELEALSIGIVSRLLFTGGTFRRFGGETLPADAASLGMTTASLLVAAVRAVDGIETLEGFIDHSSYLWAGQDALLRYQDVALSPTEGYLLSRIDGRTKAADLQRLVPMPRPQFVRAAAALVVAGLVELRPEPAGRGQTPPAPEPVARAPVAENALVFTADQQAEHDRVLRLAAEVRGKNFYARLGLARRAPTPEIEATFRGLARRYHPDRAQEEHLHQLRRELAEIYACLQDARDTLCHAERRANYDQALTEGELGHGRDEDPEQRQQARRELATANLRRARELVRSRQFGLAVELLDQAVRLNPEPNTLVFLAQLEFRNPMWIQRALDHLKHAVALDPKYTEGWLELANFWGARSDVERQRACLERVLAYDPKNPDVHVALQTLRERRSRR